MPRSTFRVGLGWAVCHGSILEERRHRHAAWQINMTREKKLAVDLGDSTIWGSVVVIRSGVRHALHHDGGRITTVFVDPDLEAARGLAKLCGASGATSMADEIALALRKFVHGVLRADTDTQQAFDKFGGNLGGPKTARPVDPRVVAALAALAENYRTQWPLTGLAKAAELSTSQLGALFRTCTGMPVRTHVRWLRIRAALTVLTPGGDITSAAGAAGYSNAQCLVSSFQRVFGVSPMVFSRRASH